MHRLACTAVGVLFGGAAVAAQPPGYACATAHPLATQACMEILAGGGNAFDAAVAASAAIAVVEPTGSGLGGGGFWLLHRQADALDVFIDGRETAPAAASRDMYLDADGQADSKRSRFGPLAAGIPGEPAALEHIAEHYGSLPLSTVLAPAIRYAADGFAVDAKLAGAIERFAGTMSPAARAVFLKNEHPLGVGELLQQPDLAWTLRRLASEGAEDFYRGQIAQRLLAAVHEAGGGWSAEDLARYAIVERAPIVSWFLGNRIVSSPPPSAGGLALAQVLQQLEVLGWRDDGTPASRHLLIETLRRAYRDRAAWLGDPDFVHIPLMHLASRSYARELARSIDPARATPSSALPPAVPSSEGYNTTHLSVLDAAGNRVAATLSINLPFGSGLMAAGTGVLLNDEMDDFSSAPGVANAYGLVGSEPNSIAPLKRPLSSMTPTFVEGPRGLLIVGTPGGSRIVTMVIQAVLAWIGGAELRDVVEAPRLHQQYLPDVVELEPDYADASAQAALSAMGYTLKLSERPWGNMQAVAWYPARGEIDAASDPRAVGQAAVAAVRKQD
ncbi:gamma-glutamyltransferase [Sinimarinibacterium sp. CAU 1509]|nr:gamma-glutamyltransferase [Sinimarinibacterium sp. CAU 1509]